jgi:hypothetical protein
MTEGQKDAVAALLLTALVVGLLLGGVGLLHCSRR